MKIVIDLQGRQSTDSKYRGIGRYSLSITKAIIRNKNIHEIVVVLSDAFKDTIDEIKKELSDILDEKNIFIWKSYKSTSFIASNNTYRKTAELNKEVFIKSLNPDLIYITSLFEGYHDDTVTSVHALYDNIPVAVTLYDLIPLINKDIYLENEDLRDWYYNKINHLKNADLLLSISESSRLEALEYLGTNPNDVINISTAADPQFKKTEINSEDKIKISKKYSITRDLLLYTGGIDHRKNIEGLIESYSLLPIHVREDHQLAIVCSIDTTQRARLESKVEECNLDKNEVIFTGFIPESDLIILYNICKAFIFPSWHEGFGLPALEAMHCGAPVIASNSSSLPEVLGIDDALFDAKDCLSMSNKIEQVLTDDVFRKKLLSHAKEQVDIFTWDNSGKVAIEAFENVLKANRRKKYSSDRLKLAFVSPLPPEHTGIADYSAELLPYLHSYYDIDVVVEQDHISNQWIMDNCNIINSSEMIDNVGQYDRVLYHFGNSHFHLHMFKLIKQIPGVVVLHDFFLSGVLYYASNNESEFFSFQEELNYSHKNEKINDSDDEFDLIMKYPCNKRVLDDAMGIIVHSEHPKELSKEWYSENYSKNWKVIPLLKVCNDFDKEQSKQHLEFNGSDILVCSFGIVDKTKQNHRLIDAWCKSSLSKDKNCKLIFVGEYLDQGYGEKILSKMKSVNSSNIMITGRLDEAGFKDHLASADIAVQLRTLSRGETSAAVLDCMSHELPTIVNANGSMASLPKEAVHMLSDEFTDDELVDALEKMYRDKKHRQNLGQKARQAIEDKHCPLKCAKQYVKAIEEFYVKNE